MHCHMHGGVVTLVTLAQRDEGFYYCCLLMSFFFIICLAQLNIASPHQYTLFQHVLLYECSDIVGDFFHP